MRTCFTVCVRHVLPIPRNLRTAVWLYIYGVVGTHILLDMNSSSKSMYVFILYHESPFLLEYLQHQQMT